MYTGYGQQALRGTYDPVEARGRFIARTYNHLFGSIVAFAAIEFALFQTGLAPLIARAMFSVSWMLVLGGFMLAGNPNDRWQTKWATNLRRPKTRPRSKTQRPRTKRKTTPPTKPARLRRPPKKLSSVLRGGEAKQSIAPQAFFYGAAGS